MTTELHKLEQPSHFERLRVLFQDGIAKRLGWLSVGKGNRQSCLDTICNDTIGLGCIALILGRGDDEARGYFAAASRYALDWLRAPGSPGGPRVYDVNVEVSEPGIRVTSEHEKAPSRQPSKLSVDGFGRIMSLTVAFGDRAHWNEVGRFPEDGYRNPDEMVGPEYYGYLRALKAYIRGDEAEAKREGRAALAGYKDSSHAKPGVAAFLALVEGDVAGFDRSIEARLVKHKRQYQKTPNDPMGLMCLHCMMLCRLAIDRGMAIPERPYLPLRFLAD